MPEIFPTAVFPDLSALFVQMTKPQREWKISSLLGIRPTAAINAAFGNF